jgi:hypothetical protein
MREPFSVKILMNPTISSHVWGLPLFCANQQHRRAFG